MRTLFIFSLSCLVAFSIQAQCKEIFFSEYIEGFNNNKVIELYNPTNTVVDLSNYRVIRWQNGSTTADSDIKLVQPLSGTIQPKGVYLGAADKRNTSATGVDTALYPELLAILNSNNSGFYSPDYDASVPGAACFAWNGDDALSLEKKVGNGWVIVDIFGKIGERPVFGSGSTATAGWDNSAPFHIVEPGVRAWTLNHTMVRKESVDGGVTENPNEFNPSTQWDSLKVNTFTELGKHNSVCNSFNSVKDQKTYIGLFPNPATDFIRLATNVEVVRIEVISIEGKVVYNEINTDNTVQIEYLSNGQYTVNLHVLDGSTVSKQIIKL